MRPEVAQFESGVEGTTPVVRRLLRWNAGAALLLLVACSPSPDRVPPPNDDQAYRIEQLAGMMTDTSTGRAPATDVGALLDNLTRFPPSEASTRMLSESVMNAVSEGQLDDVAARRLAERLYRAMNGGYLRRGALEQLVVEIAGQLGEAGVTPETQDHVRTAVVAVAREPRNPRTDWW